jgi:hypothetical protein
MSHLFKAHKQILGRLLVLGVFPEGMDPYSAHRRLDDATSASTSSVDFSNTLSPESGQMCGVGYARLGGSRYSAASNDGQDAPMPFVHFCGDHERGVVNRASGRRLSRYELQQHEILVDHYPEAILPTKQKAFHRRTSWLHNFTLQRDVSNASLTRREEEGRQLASSSISPSPNPTGIVRSYHVYMQFLNSLSSTASSSVGNAGISAAIAEHNLVGFAKSQWPPLARLGVRGVEVPRIQVWE